MKARKGNTKALIGLLVLFGLLVFYKSAMASNVEPNIPPDPKVKIITEAIKKLSGTTRGQIAAVKELQNAGEYAIPYMLDAMADDSRKEELSNIIWALPQIGRDAIRPLATALQTKDAAIKAEIIKALGKIGYPQSLAYLKYIVEKDDSAELRSLAEQSIRQIDPVALTVPATELFYRLGEKYSSHAKSLAPGINAEFANIWFWDSVNERLERKEVDRNYFYELMAERACEWAMKGDPGMVDKLQISSENNKKIQEKGRVPDADNEKMLEVLVDNILNASYRKSLGGPLELAGYWPMPTAEITEYLTETPVKVLSKPMFGIYLGEKIDDVKKRFEIKKASSNKDESLEFWFAGNKSDNIRGITIFTFEKKVIAIFVLFTDDSESNRDAIVKQLAETYTIIWAYDLGVAQYQEFLTKIDDTLTLITLDHQFFDGIKSLRIIYTHCPLAVQCRNEIRKHKAQKLSGDL